MSADTPRISFRAAALVLSLIIVVGTAVALRKVLSSPAARQAAQGLASKKFFSDDDGKSWFPDEATKFPPIEHDGKQAFEAKVFKCPGGSPFVGYLERYDVADKQRLEQAANAAASSGGMLMPGVTIAGRPEVKKPGDAQWVRLTPQTTEQYNRILQPPKCPDGSNAEPVLPP